MQIYTKDQNYASKSPINAIFGRRNADCGDYFVSLQTMKNQASIDFVRQNREGDIRQLALKGAGGKDVDLAWALDQISGWQTARSKLPQWAATEGLIYPPHLSMEQCSSELTAKYKAEVVEREIKNASPTVEDLEGTLIDLTGGFGVDFSYMARSFRQAVYVERNPQLCEIARHNFQLLGLANAGIVCGDGVEYLESLPSPNTHHPSPLTIYLDPARRDTHGQKTIKLSPMLDWHKAVEDLVSVSGVHIVSVDNECKELLMVLRGTVGKDSATRATRVCCVNLLSRGGIEEFDFEDIGSSAIHSSPIGEVRRGLFLYEPNASLMKAGCFAELAARFGVHPIAPNSHLFVSESLKEDFPGRRFQITAVSSMNRKTLKEHLRGISKANIAVRNFPLSVAELRKRLKLADGGDVYLFATTTGDKEHLLLFSKKV